MALKVFTYLLALSNFCIADFIVLKLEMFVLLLVVSGHNLVLLSNLIRSLVSVSKCWELGLVQLSIWLVLSYLILKCFKECNNFILENVFNNGCSLLNRLILVWCLQFLYFGDKFAKQIKIRYLLYLLRVTVILVFSSRSCGEARLGCKLLQLLLNQFLDVWCVNIILRVSSLLLIIFGGIKLDLFLSTAFFSLLLSCDASFN